eukprot:gene9167-16296_t
MAWAHHRVHAPGVAESDHLLIVKAELGDPPELSEWVTGEDPCVYAWPGVTCTGGIVTEIDLRGIPDAPVPSAITTALYLTKVALGKPPGLSSWINGTDPCFWLSVTCTGGVVTAVNLTGLPSTGSPTPIPAVLGEVTSLTSLTLGNTLLLTGTLPPEWSSLTNLVELNLSDSNVSGAIPPVWKGLAGLTSIDLSSNSLTSSLPPEWSSLSNLGALDLAGNSLTSSLPSEWSSLSNLGALDLAGNSLSGSLPPAWSSLSNLGALDLAGNSLTNSLPPAWSSLSNLGALDLAGNSLSGSIPTDWEGPGQAGGMTSITTIDLSSNTAICSRTPPSLVSVVKADATSIGMACANQAESDLLLVVKAELGDPPELSEWVTGEDPCVYEWPGVTCTGGIVTEIDLSGILDGASSSPTPGLLPPTLANITSLTSIKISDAPLILGKLPPQWSALTGLQHLEVVGTGALGKLPSQWSSLTQLSYLKVAGNSITSTLPQSWSTLQGLVTLNLSGNDISGSLPDTWSSLDDLTDLNLASNLLASSLPPSWTAAAPGGMASLQILTVAFNTGLCGDLPPTGATVVFDSTALGKPCVAPLANAPPPTATRPTATPPGSGPISLFTASVDRFLDSVDELPEVPGVTYSISERRVQTSFRVPRSSRAADCEDQTINDEMLKLVELLDLPSPNISVDCSPADDPANLEPAAGQKLNEGGRRSLLQEVNDACITASSYNLDFIVNPDRSMAEVKAAVQNYISQISVPECPVQEIFFYESTTVLASTNTKDTIPVVCSMWSVEASVMTSEQVSISECLIPPPAPPLPPLPPTAAPTLTEVPVPVEKGGGDETHLGLIIGLSVGGFFALLALTCCCCCWWFACGLFRRRKKQDDEQKKDDEHEKADSLDGKEKFPELDDDDSGATISAASPTDHRSVHFTTRKSDSGASISATAPTDHRNVRFSTRSSDSGATITRAAPTDHRNVRSTPRDSNSDSDPEVETNALSQSSPSSAFSLRTNSMASISSHNGHSYYGKVPLAATRRTLSSHHLPKNLPKSVSSRMSLFGNPVAPEDPNLQPRAKSMFGTEDTGRNSSSKGLLTGESAPSNIGGDGPAQLYDSRSGPSVEAWGMGPPLPPPAGPITDPSAGKPIMTRASAPRPLPKRQSSVQWAAPAPPMSLKDKTLHGEEKTLQGESAFSPPTGRRRYKGSRRSLYQQPDLSYSNSSRMSSKDFLDDDSALSAIHELAAVSGHGVGYGDRPASVSQIRESPGLKRKSSRLAN